MLNICFSEIEAENLMSTKNILSNTDTICFLADDLSIGNIQNMRDVHARELCILKYYGQFADANINLKDNYKLFYRAISNSDTITIWYSNNPKNICGLLFTLTCLYESSSDINIINCSQKLKIENMVVQYNSVENIPEKNIHLLLPYKKELDSDIRLRLKNCWNKLVRENGEIRTFCDNTVKTVDVSYYDKFILQCTSRNPIKIADVIGKVLSYLSRNYGITIYDGFLAMRIDYLIENKMLELIEKKSRFFESSICLSRKI